MYEKMKSNFTLLKKKNNNNNNVKKSFSLFFFFNLKSFRFSFNFFSNRSEISLWEKCCAENQKEKKVQTISR